jgi:hypothetical protein
LNSDTSFWARVLDTVRAQKSTVPVALTPKFAEPGAFEVEEFEEEPPELGVDEHPAAASTRAAAEKTARAAGLRIFMCGSFRHLRKKGCDWGLASVVYGSALSRLGMPGLRQVVALARSREARDAAESDVV